MNGPSDEEMLPGGSCVFSLTLKFGEDMLAIRGPVTLAEVTPLIDQFVHLTTLGLQATIDQLTQRLSDSTDRLKTSVDASTPPLS